MYSKVAVFSLAEAARPQQPTSRCEHLAVLQAKGATTARPCIVQMFNQKVTSLNPSFRGSAKAGERFSGGSDGGERPPAARGSCICPRPDLRIKIKSFDGDPLALMI